MSNDSKKILLLCATSESVINFRRGLITKLQDEGFDVAIIALDGEREEDVKKLGVEFYSVGNNNRSINPFKIFDLKKKYVKIIKAVNPDIVFTFMLKPNTIGVQATRKAGVKKIFSMVEGAGDVFINNSFKWRLIRFAVCKLYRNSFKSVQKVFFLNQDDKAEFTGRKLVEEDKCIIIPGIGVDIDHFDFKPIKNDKTFLMIARMLQTKGVFEFCQAARIVKQKYPDAIFNYLGAEGTVKVADIKEFIDDGSINYLGTTKDVRPFIEDCSVYVLPSYREGMPMSIMEAESMGRAIITNNCVGCKDVINDGENGILVEKGDISLLAEKMIWCIENPKDVEIMGNNSRLLAVEKFDKNKVNEMILEVLTI